MGRSLFDRIFGDYGGTEPAFAAKVQANAARNDPFCSDAECTPGNRECPPTGRYGQADAAMGQLRHDATYANNPNLTQAQERELSRRDVRVDHHVPTSGGAMDTPPGWHYDRHGIPVENWPAEVPVSIFDQLKGRNER